MMACVNECVALDKKTSCRSNDLNQKHIVKAERSGNEVSIASKLVVLRSRNIRSKESLVSVGKEIVIWCCE